MGLPRRIVDALIIPGNPRVMALSGIPWTAGIALWFPLFPIFLRSISLDFLSIGTVFAIGGAGALIATPIGGVAADRLGRKTLIVASGVVVLAGITLVQLATPIGVVLGFAIVMFGSYFARGPLGALLIESTTQKERGTAMSAPYFLPSLFAIPMPFLGAYLSQSFGWPIVFQISIGLVAVATGVRQVSLRETPRSPRPGSHTASSRLLDRRLLLSPLALIFLAYLLDAFSEGAHDSFLPLYFSEFLKAPVEFYGTLASAHLLSVGILALTGGKLIDRVGPPKTMILTFLAEGVLVLGLLSTMDFILAGVFFVLWTSVDFLDRFAPSVHIGSTVTDSRRSTALSAFDTATRVVKLPAPLIGALLFLVNPPLLLVLEVIVSLAAALLVLPLIRRRRRQSEGEEVSLS